MKTIFTFLIDIFILEILILGAISKAVDPVIAILILTALSLRIACKAFYFEKHKKRKKANAGTSAKNH